MNELLKARILDHYLKEYPKESCGIILNDNTYIPLKNIAQDPFNYFEIDPNIWIKYENITAIVHSHPNGKPILSTADRQMQLATGLEWWLVCNGEITKFRCMPHLLGREFEHGKTDCYAIFRDCYALSGIDFPDFKRENDWWLNGENLYLDLLPKYDFVQVDDLQLGDIVLICTGSDVPNHSAVYIGDQYIVHHSPQRLSKRDLFNGYWLKNVHSFWRYKWRSQLNYTGILADLAINLP